MDHEWEKQLDALLAGMTLEEKISLCHAASKFSTAGIPRLGVPPLTMSDGPHGVREEISADSWRAVGGDFDYATYLPVGTALAATWNPAAATRFGEVLGSEARERGKAVILGPGVNMIRTPLCGRNFEYYSEDPCLAGQLAAAAIRGIQSRGTAACVKHYALNSQELMRSRVDARCDERALREIYLPAFECAVREGGAWSLMGSYNKFRGQHCCQNDYLLNQILKKEWGFDGVVISDWAGVSDTLEAARGGMDLEMGTDLPYEEYFLAAPLLRAVEAGSVEPELVDDKARRILRLMFRTGLLGGDRYPAGERNTAAHQTAAREIAEEAIVLLKNDSHLLPLSRGKVKRLLVVGDNADRKHHLGGNSSAVKALYEITPLAGLRELAAAAGIEVEYFRGYPCGGAGEPIPGHLMGIADPGAGTRGWRVAVYPNDCHRGTPIRAYASDEAVFVPDADLPEEFSVTLEGEFTAPESGRWSFILEGCSQAQLWRDSELVISDCKSHEDVSGSAEMVFSKGEVCRFLIKYRIFPELPLYRMRLTAIPGSARAGAGGAELFAAAKRADAVLFFGGLNHAADVEGADRKDMALHDGQNELIEELARLNTALAVVLVGGAPMELPWIDRVGAAVMMWYAGMEGGRAIARILFGDVNPSGKLPFTFPKRLADSPAHALGDYAPLVCDYAEGVLTGYRWFDAKGIEPLFAFGHGLSYTEFSYSGAERIAPREDEELRARVTLTNSGRAAGGETVQLYVEPPRCAAVRPVRELRRFCKVFLGPGESKTVEFGLTRRDLSYFHPLRREWVMPAGKHVLCFGSSSRDIRIRLG